MFTVPTHFIISYPKLTIIWNTLYSYYKDVYVCVCMKYIHIYSFKIIIEVHFESTFLYI